MEPEALASANNVMIEATSANCHRASAPLQTRQDINRLLTADDVVVGIEKRPVHVEGDHDVAGIERRHSFTPPRSQQAQLHDP